MLFKDKITLFEMGIDTTKPFQTETILNQEDVYANVKSISRLEFATASGLGIAAQYIFEVREGEYNNQSYVKYNSEKYAIYRTYVKGFVIELYAKSLKAGE